MFFTFRFVSKLFRCAVSADHRFGLPDVAKDPLESREGQSTPKNQFNGVIGQFLNL